MRPRPALQNPCCPFQMDFNSVHQKLKSKAGKTKDHPTVRTARAEHKRTPMALSHHLLHDKPELRLVLAPGINVVKAGGAKQKIEGCAPRHDKCQLMNPRRLRGFPHMIARALCGRWLDDLASGAAHDEIASSFFWSGAQNHGFELSSHPHGKVIRSGSVSSHDFNCRHHS